MENHAGHHDPTLYHTVQEAMNAPAERLAYIALLKPNAIGVVDVDPASASYGQLVGRWDAPVSPTGQGEFHHYGWNLCSSALGHGHHHEGPLERRYLVVPDIRSSEVHILDTRPDPRQPTLVKTVSANEVLEQSGYSRLHTVHCGPHGLFLSALGNAGTDGDGPGGILTMNHDTFAIEGPWEADRGSQYLAYDFWWHVEANVLVASEWGTPNMVENGLDVEALVGRRYGHRLHFFDLATRAHIQEIDLGDQYQMALEVRPAHDPTKNYGFLGVVIDVTNLASSIWTWYRDERGTWRAVKTIEIEAVPLAADRLPPLLKDFGAVPPLLTDIDLSLDDRYLYASCWGTGELHQYDVSDPFHPTLKSVVRLGGILHRAPHPSGKAFAGAPQMIEVSRDGRRLYGTNSLYGTWDDQFYPEGLPGSMFKVDIDPEGGMTLDPRFHVTFGETRAHQIRLEGGDCSTDSFCFVA